MAENNIPKKDLTAELQDTGVTAGDCLILHCSFKPLKVAGYTPDRVIDAFLDVLGPSGTLMMPTFTYSYSGIWNVIPFNPDSTPGIENGILSETFRLRSGVLRSGHPTYSVAAFGKHAKFLTSNRDLCSPLGHGSSYEDAMKLDAKILLLGVGNNRNSMIHHLEVVAGLPYNDIPFRKFWGDTALVEKNGRTNTVPLVPEYPACSDNFSWLDKILLQKEIAREGQIGGASAFLINARNMKDCIIEQVRQKADCLLCSSIICEPCNLRRQRLKDHGLI
jgi:aminoglycoside N3'-acetyltransferase